MTIPGGGVDDDPPALPLLRCIRDIDNGVDIVYKYHVENPSIGNTRVAPIKAELSVLGSPHTQSAKDESEDSNMDVDIGINQVLSAPRSPSQSQLATGATISSFVRKQPSSSGINQRSVLLVFVPKSSTQSHLLCHLVFFLAKLSPSD